MSLRRAALLIMMSLLVFSITAFAKTAGTTKFALGKVLAKGAVGDVRILRRGSEFLTGDIVDTGLGRAQLQFLDGSFISLQPATVFHVDDYVYRPNQKSGSSLVVEVVKGGLRMVTGAIGKQQPAAVEVKTPVGTIGIRGTGFTLRLCNGDCSTKRGSKIPDGLYSWVTNGKIIVRNAGGELLVPSGQSVYVKNESSAPSFTKVIPLILPKNITARDSLREERKSGVGLASTVDDAMPPYQAGDQIGPTGLSKILPLGSLGIVISFP